jgi:multiple sugar transport system substrate-binding protein
VAAADPLYKSGGALQLWGQELAHACPSDAITASCTAVYRPTTPGYPTISAKFAGAVSAIWGGADAQSSLSDAAKAIDQNFSDNNGYK